MELFKNVNNMKKVFLTFAMAALAAVAWAEDAPKKPSVAGFVSNGFWDNWEVSAGVGVGTAFSTGTNPGSFSDRINYEANVSVAKWLHPVFGVRGQVQFGKFSNYAYVQGLANSQGDKYAWPYVFVHADFMVNFSNWVGGYRADRVYYAVPFVGFGYFAGNISDKSQQATGEGMSHAFAFSYGLLNKFRVSKSVDINLELKGLLTPSSVAPVAMDGSYLCGFSATVGATYRFNKRGWERGVPGYTAEDIRAFQDAVAAGNAALEAAKAENTRLTNDLKAARADAEAAKAAAAAEAAAAAKRAAAAAKVQSAFPTSVILYDYSMSKISGKEKTRLELMAEVIKNGPKDRVYRIEGHADQQTGTAAGNKRVAENRAKNVYDFLVKCGVNPDQLTYEGKGNEANIYPENQKANRAVIIK